MRTASKLPRVGCSAGSLDSTRAEYSSDHARGTLTALSTTQPSKSFDAILNAVILELQRTPGAKVKVTLEIEANAPSGFDPSEVGIVRDNAKQLKFTAEATGFD